MKIGICDDEPNIVNMLQKLIEQSLKKVNQNAEIITFFSGSSLIKRAEELDVVFLDIEMPGMDGYETGREVKSKNPDCKIIMATGRVDRFKESFKITAFRFTTKPFEACEIDEAIEAVIKTIIGEDIISLYLNRIQYDVEEKNIQYLKAFNGYIEAVVDDKCLRRDLSLNEMEELIDSRLFVRVNKQYIVNMKHIRGYKNNEILISGMTIPVSRRKQKEFEKKYMEFDVNFRG